MNERNKPEQVKDQSMGATPPDLKLNQTGKGFEQSVSPAVATGHGAAPDQTGVAAGHGNQVLDNETRKADQNKQNDLKPGALPDGTASVGSGESRNEDVEQADKSRAASGIE